MIFEHDYFQNITIPYYVLCKANGDRIGIINCTEKKTSLKFNAYNEISFITYMNMDGIKNEYYDLVKEGKFIELPLIGRYVITDVSVQSEATDFEYKECTALSSEVLLAQKYVENFTINMGTTESIDGVRLYHQSDPSKSLLHLLLEKCPDWTIGYVDVSLREMERCFEIDRQDVYGMLVNDVSQAFQCIFIFDSLYHRINVYEEKNVGKDTNIFISYENLLKNTNISSSIEDIKTCLTVTGSDDLNLREVNMGYDRIYNLEYFNSLEYMSEELYTEYNAWKTLWNDYVDDYEKLVLEYQEYYNDIYELKSKKMPAVTGSTNWTEYGLVPLQEQLAAYEQKQAVMIKMGQGEKDHKDYNDIYLPCYNAIQEIKSQIAVVEKQLADLEAKQAKVGEQMAEIAEITSMQNNFSSASLKELTKYIREDELSSDNFIVTDTMTDTERMDMLNEMLKYGQEELAKVSQPVLEFDSNIINLYNIPEFRDYIEDFEPGNYIHIAIRDDYIVKARILTMDIDWNNPENFSVTFSNIMKLKGSRILSSVNEALDLATSAATSVSMNSSYWNKANRDSSDIMDMLAEGLAAAGQAIHTSASDVVVDDRGIIISNIPESEYPLDRIFIGGSQILFSDDDFKTIRTALGRLTYTKQGVEYNDFGLMADFVIAGYIAGSIIEGNDIIGGTLKSKNYNSGKYGTFINLNDGTFEFNGAGEKKLYFDGTTLTAKGTIQAEKGWFGGANGFKIESGKIYSGSKSTLSSTADGVYIGTDGISLGSGNKFTVTNKGALTASDVTITGGSLNINNKFKVDKDGTMTATSGSFSGNISSSSIESGTINGATITGGSLTIGDNFSVDTNGKLVAKSGTFSKGTITGAVIKAGKTYELQSDERYMFYVDDERMNLGDFNIIDYNGRYILQSYDEFTGMSPCISSTSSKLAFWAAWNSDTDYGLTVSQQGTTKAKYIKTRFMYVGNPGKDKLIDGTNVFAGENDYGDIKLEKLDKKWGASDGSEWASVSYNIIELWRKMSGVIDRLDNAGI